MMLPNIFSKQIVKKIAVFLLALMFIHSNSLSLMILLAETEPLSKCGKGIVIHVMDESGKSVSGAAVEYLIEKEEDAEFGLIDKKFTNKCGLVQILDKDSHQDGTRLTAVISYEGYITDETTIYKRPLEKASEQIEVKLKPEIDSSQFQVIFSSNLVYNGQEQALIERTEGASSGDILEYRVNGETWTRNLPVGENEGEYRVEVKVIRGTGEVVIAEETVTIAKASQRLKFREDRGEEETLQIKGLIEDEGKKFDFSATTYDEAPILTGAAIRYDLSAEEPFKDIARIDENTGEVTVFDTGTFRVKAMLTSTNSNYESTKIESIVTVRQQAESKGQFISFAEPKIEYILNSHHELPAQQVLSKLKKQHTVKYSIDQEAVGLAIHATSGAITVEDYGILAGKLEENSGELTVTVKAQLKADEFLDNMPDSEFADEAVYLLRISFGELPPVPYTLEGKPGEDGWYISEVTVLPAKGYLISRMPLPDEFVPKQRLNDTSDTGRKFYLTEEKTGNITRPFSLEEVKVDTIRPKSEEIRISYSEPVIGRQVDDKIYQFYKDKVIIEFKGKDANSGIKEFYWKYNRETEASSNNLEQDSGVVPAVKDKEDGSLFAGQIWLPRAVASQLRGRIHVIAKDHAGLTSEEKTGDNVFVIDTIAPKAAVEFKSIQPLTAFQKVGNSYYYSDSVEVKIKITESNFYPEDVEVWLTENGVATRMEQLSWENTSVADEYAAKMILSAESEYQVGVKYKDRSGNEMKEFQSERYIIDRTAPEIEFHYFNHLHDRNPQSVLISIKEKNFSPQDIVVATNVKDISGNALVTADFQKIVREGKWERDGDIHTLRLDSELTEGIHRWTIHYRDLAKNPAKQLVTEHFTIDRSPASVADMSVYYSVPIHQMVLSGITFGFYNPTVTVTLSAKDHVSGIEHFVWSYTKKEGESLINRGEYQDTILQAVQSETDKAEFNASFTLPKDKADQLRGSIAFTAMDRAGNQSEKITDSKRIIVVDTVAPTMSVEYSSPVHKTESRMYYQGAVEMTFTVTEANFYKEDVKIELIRDRQKPVVLQPNWQSKSVDEHIARYTIDAPSNHSGDGDYQILVTYTDKSGNEMPKYTSGILVVDTIRPVIEVSYSETEPESLLTDAEGNLRSYYSKEQIATVTVTEHNFDPQGMAIKIGAKDITGKDLNLAELVKQSAWNSQGDRHTLTIAYSGDANYSFDIAANDFARNPAEARPTDYLTVDKVMPENLEISYSTSLYERALEAVTFGYYNAKVTVTVSATDDISGIKRFAYNYRNAGGEGSGYRIEEARIQFSADGKKGTASFPVPEDSTQFKDSIDFRSIDRAENASDYLQDNKRLIVDTIAPNMTIQYNQPVLREQDIAYYNSAVEATISILEENFYPEDIVVIVTEKEREIPVNIAWTSNQNSHTGSFSLETDGDYYVSISYTDRSRNKMEDYRSQQIRIDTKISEARILINGIDPDHKSFNHDMAVEVSFEDENFDSYEIKIFKANLKEKAEEVTQQLIAEQPKLSRTGGSIKLNSFEKVREVDGVYTMSVLVRDKAAHESLKQVRFSVNRFGSVYQYEDYLNQLIQDGGAYVKEIVDDLVITEYNASPLVEKSLDINISLDGKPLENIIYTERRVTEKNPEELSWNRYEYRISKENFTQEGIYKVSISTKDEAGNYPENNNYPDKIIQFYVDKTAPEINSIIGLEKSIINAVEAEVSYTLFDSIGLKSVVVYVSGEELVNITEFGENRNQFGGSFTLRESAAEQTVQIVVEDLAGNITDTKSKDFSSYYDFHSGVIVSTNALVRWYANKKLFWGSIAASVVSLAGIGGYVFLARKN